MRVDEMHRSIGHCLIFSLLGACPLACSSIFAMFMPNVSRVARGNSFPFTNMPVSIQGEGGESASSTYFH